MAIEFCWDEESFMWIAVSHDIPGLALESDSLDVLVVKVGLEVFHAVFAGGVQLE